MNPDDVAAVRLTWALILPRRKEVCRNFYLRLFARYPELQPLFRGDMTRQADLFVTMINTVVSALENPQSVRPLIETLGARHADYGVSIADYRKFEDVLLAMLAEVLGNDFSAQAAGAWKAVFQDLAATMQTGAPR